MRKLLCLLSAALLSAALLVLTSCSNDDSTDEASVMLKKMTQTFDNGQIHTYEYFYNGKMLKSINSTSDNEYNDYNVIVTYTGDLITKQEYFRTNTLFKILLYDYNANGQIIMVRDLAPTMNDGYKQIFIYSLDGSISKKYYSGDYNSQTTLDYTEKIFFQNEEVNKIERYYSSGTLSKTQNFIYDTKNTPFKNILGFNKRGVVRQTHNIVTHTAYYPGLPSTFFNNISYTYDSNNFPLTQNDENENYTLQYFYE